MYKRILGIDPSHVATGWAFLEKGEIKEYGVIRPGKLRGDPRLYFIEKEIKEILKKFKPSLGIVEGYAYQKSRGGGMVFNIGELGWCIRRGLFIRNIKIKIVNPTTLKKQIAGYGHASKGMMFTAAKKISGCSFPGVPLAVRDNVVDAFCLAEYGRRNRRRIEEEIC